MTENPRNSSLVKSQTVQFEPLPPLPLKLDISKSIITPDLSPKAPKSIDRKTLPFSTTLRKLYQEVDHEYKKSQFAMQRQTLDYFQTLAILPRFVKAENKEIQNKKNIFDATKNLLEKPHAIVMKNQMIYKTDNPKYIVNLMNLRKNYYDNRPLHNGLGKIYITEFWDKIHFQNIVSNSKLLDKARNLGVYEGRKSFVNFQELLEKHQIIEERSIKKAGIQNETEMNLWGNSPSGKSATSSFSFLKFEESLFFQRKRN